MFFNILNDDDDDDDVYNYFLSYRAYSEELL